MNPISFIKSHEKKKILEHLDSELGIKELNYQLIRSGNEKIRAFSGSLSKEQIEMLSKIVNVEVVGIYFLKQEHDIRLSFDACHLIKDKITKNIIEIDDEQYHKWIRGNDIEFPSPIPQGVVVISYKGDLIGCAKAKDNIVLNYVPKERRLRK